MTRLLLIFLATIFAACTSKLEGTVRYEHCQSDDAHTGFTCNHYALRPARNVELRVTVADANGATSKVTGRTDDTGAFEIPVEVSVATVVRTEVVIPSESVLFTNTPDLIYEGRVHPGFHAALVTSTDGALNFDIDIVGRDAAELNAYDNILAARRWVGSSLGWSDADAIQNLNRVVVSLDGTWCIGGATHTQQTLDVDRTNTFLCVGDAFELGAHRDKHAATMFSDGTILHEYAHHVQNVLGQWRPIPRYHNGCWVTLQEWDLGPVNACGAVDSNPDVFRWDNSATYAWFEGFPNFLADRAAASVGRLARTWIDPSSGMQYSLHKTTWCDDVGGTFCGSTVPSTLPCACNAIGHKAGEHTIGAADIEDYTSAVLQEAIAAGTLRDADVMGALWQLRKGFPDIYAVRAAMASAGANMTDLDTFMANYGM